MRFFPAKLFLVFGAVLGMSCTPEQSTSPSGKAEGLPAPDFIAPEEEILRIGLAGAYPADIARYLMVHGAAQASLSSDGKHIAYTSSITGKPQLYIMEKTGGAGRQLTFGNGITFYRWAPDGNSLIYGADNNGNEQESYYIISVSGTQENEILPASKGGFRVFGGFSGDGNHIAYASTERNGLDFDIYMANIKTGKPNRIYEGKYGFFVNAVSPDARHLIISETVGEDGDNLFLLDVNSGKTSIISKPAFRANHTSHGVVWHNNGQDVYFATNRDREFTALSNYNLGSGEITTLYENDSNIENVTLCGLGAGLLAFTNNEDGFDALYLYTLASGSATPVSGLPGGVYRLSCAPGTNDLIVQINAWDRPGDIFHIDLSSLNITRVFTSNLAGLSADTFIKPEVLHMKAQDGVQLQGLLYMPHMARPDSKKPPVVFEVHGGPSAQARPSYNGSIQHLLGKGIAVFQPNVRGSTGFGRTYSALDDQEKRLDSVRDIIDMLAYLKQDGRVDTSRAAVSGGSYGGYVVNAVLAAYPDAFAAGVSRYSVADWVTALEIASPALKASDIIEYGDITDPKWQAFYTVNSPIRQADRIKVPVLFSHGAMDPRIDIFETETMVRAVRANGIDVTYIRIPDEGHGWRKFKNRMFYFRRQAKFLEKHLGATSPNGQKIQKTNP